MIMSMVACLRGGVTVLVAALLLVAPAPQSVVNALSPATGSESVGPGSGVNKAAREAVYATCHQCNLQACCTPVEKALNTLVNNCTNNATKLDCGCLERTIFADPGVKAATGTCGCSCTNCCYDALNAGSETKCPQSHCGVPAG